MDFDGLVRNALDTWSEHPSNEKPDNLVLKIQPLTSGPGINLHLMDLTPDAPEDYILATIVEKTDQRRNGNARLGDIPDQSFIRNNVIPAYMEARNSRHPVIDYVSAQVFERYYIYDRIILPQKRDHGPAQWALGLVVPRLILPIPDKYPEITDIEILILKHLMEGDQPKEIGPDLDLSRRSIEHRIQALKLKFGAKNVTHLVALAITTGLLGRTRYSPPRDC